MGVLIIHDHADGGDGGSGESPTIHSNSSRPPRITLAPEDNVTISTAHPHALTMLVGYDRGNPLCTLVWRKDGEIITSRRNPRVSVMSSGGISIRSVRSSDRGLYTVTVSNAVGSDSASFRLFTNCKCWFNSIQWRLRWCGVIYICPCSYQSYWKWI